MSPEQSLLTDAERAEITRTVLSFPPLDEQYADAEQAHDASSLGMWIFLATEVMFFGTLFVALAVYRLQYPEAFEKASERLNWLIGGINTLVLLVSSLSMVLAVHAARFGQRRMLLWCLGITAILGVSFLCLKGLEYYLDYQENLIPGWRFDEREWIDREGLSADQVPHAKLFLVFYWVMTGLHGLHVIGGIGCVMVLLAFAWRGMYSPAYYTPVDVVGLYWHFVDVVWIFLLPMLYLLGTHAGLPH